MTLFHAETCYRLVSEHETSARHLCSSVKETGLYLLNGRQVNTKIAASITIMHEN